MMFFLRDRDKKLKLIILGYEYMMSEVVEDLNWLNIEIIASDLKNNWSSSGSYLRTFDLVEMRSWFSDIQEGKQVSKRLDFIEHELSFEYYEEKQELSVNLDYGLHPNGEGYRANVDSEYKMIFSLSAVNMDTLLATLKTLIDKFPIRFFQSDNSIN